MRSRNRPVVRDDAEARQGETALFAPANRQRRDRLAACLKLVSGLSILTNAAVAQMANAQTTTTQSSPIILQAVADNDIQTLTDTNGQAFAIGNGTSSGDGGSDLAVAAASFGVLHARDSSSSIFGAANNAQGGVAAGSFGDIVYVFNDNENETAMIPVTVTMVLNGTLEASPATSFDLNEENSDGASADISALWASVSQGSTVGSIINQGDYTETLAYIEGVEQGGAPTGVGVLTFTTMLQNDTDYFLEGTLEAESHAFFGGSALANYNDTGIFDVTSTDPGTTFIGSFGTNYGTLTDNGGANAPEPTSLMLALPAIGALGIARLRRRRRATIRC